MTAAISAPRRRNTSSTAAASLKGTVTVSSASARGTPGLSGRPSVATPLPVRVHEPAAGGPGHEKGRSAHCPERPNRGADAAGHQLLGPVEQLARPAHVSATARKSYSSLSASRARTKLPTSAQPPCDR